MLLTLAADTSKVLRKKAAYTHQMILIYDFGEMAEYSSASSACLSKMVAAFFFTKYRVRPLSVVGFACGQSTHRFLPSRSCSGGPHLTSPRRALASPQRRRPNPASPRQQRSLIALCARVHREK